MLSFRGQSLPADEWARPSKYRFVRLSPGSRTRRPASIACRAKRAAKCHDLIRVRCGLEAMVHDFVDEARDTQQVVGQDAGIIGGRVVIPVRLVSQRQYFRFARPRRKSTPRDGFARSLVSQPAERPIVRLGGRLVDFVLEFFVGPRRNTSWVVVLSQNYQCRSGSIPKPWTRAVAAA